MKSSETGTKKCQDAEAKGVQIVDEAWITARIAGASSEPVAAKVTSQSSAYATGGKGRGAKKASKGGDDDDDGQDENDNNKGSQALEGLCFAITGTLSVTRAQFEALITKNGGTVAKTVTNKCTHLVR